VYFHICRSLLRIYIGLFCRSNSYNLFFIHVGLWCVFIGPFSWFVFLWVLVYVFRRGRIHVLCGSYMCHKHAKETHTYKTLTNTQKRPTHIGFGVGLSSRSHSCTVFLYVCSLLRVRECLFSRLEMKKCVDEKKCVYIHEQNRHTNLNIDAKTYVSFRITLSASVSLSLSLSLDRPLARSLSLSVSLSLSLTHTHTHTRTHTLSLSLSLSLSFTHTHTHMHTHSHSPPPQGFHVWLVSSNSTTIESMKSVSYSMGACVCVCEKERESVCVRERE